MAYKNKECPTCIYRGKFYTCEYEGGACIVSGKCMGYSKDKALDINVIAEKLEKTHSAWTNAPAIWDLQKLEERIEMNNANQIIHERVKKLENPKENEDVLALFILGSELEGLLERYDKENPIGFADVYSSTYSKLRNFIQWLYKNGYEIKEKKCQPK